MNRSAFLAFIMAILTPLTLLALGTPAAWADTCTGTNHIWIEYHWTRPGWDVEGVRAPVQVRLDGGLCDGGAPATQYTYIAIQNPSTLLNQAGLAHTLVSGVEKYCRFYAAGDGSNPKLYDCNDSNDTNVFFKIHTWNGGLQYLIADCGTGGGYSNCTVKYDQDNVYVYPTGAVSAEIYNACDVHIMGGSGNPQNVGNNNYYIQGLDATGAWSARSWGFQGNAYCTANYITSEQNSGEIIDYYDTRNSQ